MSNRFFKITFQSLIITLLVLLTMTNKSSSEFSFLPDDIENITDLPSFDIQYSNSISENNQNEIFYSKNLKKQPNSYADPSDYSLYLFVVAVGSTYCKTQKNPDYCINKRKQLTDKNALTIHGLWPNKDNGQSDECNPGKTININFDDNLSLKSKMDQMWPSYAGANNSFWTHEFNKHGMCYNARTQTDGHTKFFEVVLNLYNDYKIDGLADSIISKVEASQDGFVEFQYDELEDLVSKYLGGVFFEFNCKNKDKVQYLDDIRMYLDLDLKRMIGYTLRSNCNKRNLIRIYFE